MKIHELPADPGRKQKKKRLGRGEGSGRGKTAGKGNKGHQARAGHSKRSPFEGGQMPLMRRIPKFGFTNPFRKEYEVVNVSSLDKVFDTGATVDVEALKKARLVRTDKPVKVLGNGNVSKSFTLKVHAVSQSALDKISNAGGSVELIK